MERSITIRKIRTFRDYLYEDEKTIERKNKNERREESGFRHDSAEEKNQAV